MDSQINYATEMNVVLFIIKSCFVIKYLVYCWCSCHSLVDLSAPWNMSMNDDDKAQK